MSKRRGQIYGIVTYVTLVIANVVGMFFFFCKVCFEHEKHDLFLNLVYGLLMFICAGIFLFLGIIFTTDSLDAMYLPTVYRRKHYRKGKIIAKDKCHVFWLCGNKLYTECKYSGNWILDKSDWEKCCHTLVKKRYFTRKIRKHGYAAALQYLQSMLCCRYYTCDGQDKYAYEDIDTSSIKSKRYIKLTKHKFVEAYAHIGDDGYDADAINEDIKKLFYKVLDILLIEWHIDLKDYQEYIPEKESEFERSLKLPIDPKYQNWKIKEEL